jgi:phenylacetate-CoA ligase
VSIAVRRLARTRPDVRAALFGPDPRLPIVFQYNPLIHFLEVNAHSEIVATVSRLDLLAPRIRYNVHDEGGVMDYGSMRRALGSFGCPLESLGTAAETFGPRGPLPWQRPIHLPFLWIYGRRDATISVMGANIYPEDLESVIYGDPELTRRVQSFQMAVVTDDTGTPRPSISLEFADLQGVDDRWHEDVTERIRLGLFNLNRDYRASTAEFPAAMRPIVEVWPLGGGPFAGDRSRIKQRRIAASGSGRADTSSSG